MNPQSRSQRENESRIELPPELLRDLHRTELRGAGVWKKLRGHQTTVFACLTKEGPTLLVAAQLRYCYFPPDVDKVQVHLVVHSGLQPVAKLLLTHGGTAGRVEYEIDGSDCLQSGTHFREFLAGATKSKIAVIFEADDNAVDFCRYSNPGILKRFRIFQFLRRLPKDLSSTPFKVPNVTTPPQQVSEENGNNLEANIHVLEAKASAGDAQAQYEIGFAYRNGEGVPQNSEQAVYWYAKACEHGHSDALFHLGMMKGAGEGCRADDAEAQRLLSLAADQGHKMAQVTLEQLSGIDEAARQRMNKLNLE